MVKQAKEIKESEKFLHIEQSIKRALGENEKESAFYIDLLNDYMDLWIMKERLIKNIHSKGIMAKYNHGGGQKGTKKNEAVDQLLKVNKQMLTILSELGLERNKIGGSDDPL